MMARDVLSRDIFLPEDVIGLITQCARPKIDAGLESELLAYVFKDGMMRCMKVIHKFRELMNKLDDEHKTQIEYVQAMIHLMTYLDVMTPEYLESLTFSVNTAWINTILIKCNHEIMSGYDIMMKNHTPTHNIHTRKNKKKLQKYHDLCIMRDRLQKLTRSVSFNYFQFAEKKI